MIGVVRFVWDHPIAGRNRIRALARVASWQVRSRLQGEVVVPWIGGQRLLVRRGMTGATGNIYAGLHEFVDMAFLLHFLRPADLFLDIGANIGSYTVLASGVCRANTWAFEPDPTTAGHLRRNIAVNALGDLVTVHPVALGPSAGKVPFTRGHDTMNKVSLATGEADQVVQQVTLDSIARDAEPIMIKMDVEGYESQVLAGATTVLHAPSLVAVACETVTPKMREAFAGAGFERLHYNPFARTLSPTAVGLAGSNELHVRNRELVQERVRSAPCMTVHGVSF